jgi:hypothetical protein
VTTLSAAGYSSVNSVARFAGSVVDGRTIPGAYAPGFTLPPALQALNSHPLTQVVLTSNKRIELRDEKEYESHVFRIALSSVTSSYLKIVLVNFLSHESAGISRSPARLL